MESTCFTTFLAIAVIIALTACSTHSLGLPDALTIYMLVVASFLIVTSGLFFFNHMRKNPESSMIYLICYILWLLLLLSIMIWIIIAVIELPD